MPRSPLARPPPRARREAAWTPGATPGSPLWHIYPSSPKTLKIEEFTEFRRRSMVETYGEEKPSPASRFRRAEHLPEGEIVSIVITIVTSIIEIIIAIILIISTRSICRYPGLAYVIPATTQSHGEPRAIPTCLSRQGQAQNTLGKHRREGHPIQAG